MAILITGSSNGAKFSLDSEYMLEFTGSEYSLKWATDMANIATVKNNNFYLRC